MRLLFLQKINLESNLSQESILNKLLENTDLGKDSMNFKTDKTKLFLGKKEGSKLILERNINYRNSYNPVIKIEVSDDLETRMIKISFSLNYFTLFITYTIILFLLIISYFSFSEKNPNYYITIILMITITLFSKLSFNNGCKKNVELIKKLV